ncbi:MAG: M56 family metallopeptidase [Victivallaceae bacterium]|nr:M56 family metallopeptidase [Victivallaceae bacterium]
MQWLLANSVKGAVLALAILLVQFVFTKHIPLKWKYFMWMLLAVRLAMPPLFESEASFFNIKALWSNDNREKTLVIPVAETPALSNAVSRAKPPIAVSGKKPPIAVSGKTYSLSEIIFRVWSAGALALLFWIVFKNCRFLALVRREKPVLENHWLALLESCKEELGIYTPVQMLETSCVKSPALMGFIRPRFLLPRRIFESMTENELRMVFLHELIHLKRGDVIVNWLISFIQALHWFNPLVWLGFGMMREQREQVCDEAVISFMGPEENKVYGKAIVKLLEFSPDISAVKGMTCILEDRKQIERRMKMIKGFRKTSGKAVVYALVLFSVTGFLFLSEAKEKEKENAAKKELNDSALQRRLKSIVLGPLEFQNVSLSGVLYYLNDKAKQLDPEKKGVNFVVSSELFKQSPLVNLNVENMPLGEIIKYVCRIAGVKYRIEPYAVVIVAQKDKEGFQKKVENITEVNNKEKASAAKKELNDSALQKKLKSIIVRLNVEDAPLPTVLEVLREEAKQSDPEKKGINIVLLNPELRKQVVTIRLENIPLREVFKYIAMATGTKCRIESNAVVFEK